jgi:hypothetical protein
MSIPPFVPCCYEEECWAHDSEALNPEAVWAGPCWGKGEVIDEEYTEDEHWWIHACEGHRERWGKYRAP